MRVGRLVAMTLMFSPDNNQAMSQTLVAMSEAEFAVIAEWQVWMPLFDKQQMNGLRFFHCSDTGPTCAISTARWFRKD